MGHSHTGTQQERLEPAGSLRCRFGSSLHPHHTHLLFDVVYLEMARAAQQTTMQTVFEKAETPIELQTFITTVLGLQKLQDFLAYVVRKDYETEWKGIIEGAYPVQVAQEAGEGAAAVLAFTQNDQRYEIAQMRTTYRIAIESLDEDAFGACQTTGG